MNLQKYNDFIWRHNGFYREYDNNPHKNQCMDLFFFYLKEVIGIDPKPYQGWGNPINLWNNFDRIKGAKDTFEKVVNTPNGIPTKGSIMIYKLYPFIYGRDGHVDIFDHGDVYTTVCFGQNYPTGKPCQFVKHGSGKVFHGYRGCVGWLKPKK